MYRARTTRDPLTRLSTEYALVIAEVIAARSLRLTRASRRLFMNKKIAIFALLVASVAIGMPISVSASSTATETAVTTGGAQISVRIGQPRRRYRRGGYWRNGTFYRNYGQYRRTQVGWRGRSYRMVPRYYWRDGRRFTTYRRVYYYR